MSTLRQVAHPSLRDITDVICPEHLTHPHSPQEGGFDAPGVQLNQNGMPLWILPESIARDGKDSEQVTIIGITNDDHKDVQFHGPLDGAGKITYEDQFWSEGFHLPSRISGDLNPDFWLRRSFSHGQLVKSFGRPGGVRPLTIHNTNGSDEVVGKMKSIIPLRLHRKQQTTAVSMIAKAPNSAYVLLRFGLLYPTIKGWHLKPPT